MTHRIHRVVSGYPIALETLCLMIKNKQTESKAFNYALDYVGLSETELWDVYLAWCDKRVHPLSIKLNQKVHGVIEPKSD